MDQSENTTHKTGEYYLQVSVSNKELLSLLY